MPEIKVPAVLAGGAGTERVEVDGETVREVLDSHAAEYGTDLRDSVLAAGEIREYINVYVDGEEVASLDADVDPDSLIRIMPAASGGSY